MLVINYSLLLLKFIRYGLNFFTLKKRAINHFICAGKKMSILLPKFLNRSKNFSVILLLALVILVLIVSVQRILQRLEPVAVEPRAPLAVETQVLAFSPFALTRRYSGSVVAEQRVQLSARVNAPVVAVYHREGEQVKRGDLLIRLDDRELNNERLRLQAARQRLHAELEYWSRQYQRNKKLLQKKMLSERQLEESLRMKKTLQASMQENAAALANAEIRLNYTKITAPFSARIQRLMTEVGDQTVPGKALLELVSTQNMKALVSVPQADLGRLQTGLPVQLRIPVSGLLQQTRIQKIYPALDPATRNALFETGFIHDEKQTLTRLYPGMVVEATVILEQHAALSIPHHALHKNKRGEGVFVVLDGVAKWRQVSSGGVDADRVLILSGLTPGEQIIVTPDPRLVDGLAVVVASSYQGG